MEKVPNAPVEKVSMQTESLKSANFYSRFWGSKSPTVEEDQDKVMNHLDENEKLTMYFMGFQSENLSLEEQIKEYSPLFDAFGEDVGYCVYRWHAEDQLLGLFDISQTIWNTIVSKESWKGDTAYRNALENSFTDADLLFEKLEEHNMVNAPELNFVGYSLGTQFTFNMMMRIQQKSTENLKNGGKSYTINNIVLLAGVLSSDWLISYLGDFMADDGVMKGNLVIVESENDRVLKHGVERLKVNSYDRNDDGVEEKNDDPVGRCNFKIEDAVKKINRSKAPFNKMNDEELESFLRKRIHLVNCSEFENTKGDMIKLDHLDYFKPENFEVISSRIKPHINISK
jgi:hypothetical protein